MPVLLHLDSSPMGEQSISRRLTSEFARLWQSANPHGKITYRDITATSIPAVSAEWVAANYTPVEARTPEQHRILSASTELTQELLDADECVLGVPLHNWGPPAVFKLWIDQIVRFGLTMQITPRGLQGMVHGKRLTIFLAAGRRYGRGFEDPAKNHLEPWLRTFFEDLGIRDMRVILIDGTAAIRRGQTNTESFLAPHIESVHALFANALSA
jgi:FMN-dependent NADH-azoreductase